MTNVIAHGSNLKSKCGPIGVERVAQFRVEKRLVRVEEFAEFVGHGFDTPILDRFRRGFAERLEFCDGLVAKIEDDALGSPPTMTAAAL
jgi:hypothetical protein